MGKKSKRKAKKTKNNDAKMLSDLKKKMNRQPEKLLFK